MRAAGLCVLLLGLTATAGACGGTDKKSSATPPTKPPATKPTAPTAPTSSISPGPTTPSSSLPPTTTQDQLKQQILDDYKKANDAYYTAFSTGNPGLPALAATHSGVNLKTIQKHLTDLAAVGVVAKAGPHSHDTSRAVVEQVFAGQAVVQDCVIDDAEQIRAGTGEVVDAKVVTRTLHVEMQPIDGTWKVVTAKALHEWEGESACA